MPDLRNYALVALATLAFVLGISAWSYRIQAKASSFALAAQNKAIKQQNETANRRLVQLTNERDAKQAELDKRAAAQGKTDEKAVAQIGADDKQQRAAPVRVRVLNCTRDAGSSSGSARGGPAPAAEAGAADASSAGGVLSKAGARRLADALTEIETMSAAYSSCRSHIKP